MESEVCDVVKRWIVPTLAVCLAEGDDGGGIGCATGLVGAVTDAVAEVGL